MRLVSGVDRPASKVHLLTLDANLQTCDALLSLLFPLRPPDSRRWPAHAFCVDCPASSLDSGPRTPNSRRLTQLISSAPLALLTGPGGIFGRIRLFLCVSG
jgi:hypothetical protein